MLCVSKYKAWTVTGIFCLYCWVSRGCSSVVEVMLCMYEPLGSVSSLFHLFAAFWFRFVLIWRDWLPLNRWTNILLIHVNHLMLQEEEESFKKWELWPAGGAGGQVSKSQTHWDSSSGDHEYQVKVMTGFSYNCQCQSTMRQKCLRATKVHGSQVSVRAASNKQTKRQHPCVTYNIRNSFYFQTDQEGRRGL